MVVTEFCKSCDKEVNLSNDEEGNTRIEVVPVHYMPTGEQHEIMFYICPHCEEIKTVQIDNAETKKLLLESVDLLSKAKKTKSEKRKQVLKLSFQSKTGELNNTRLKLSLWADGKIFKDYKGKDIVYTAQKTKAVENG